MRAPKKSKTYGLFKNCNDLWDRCGCPWLGRFRGERYINLARWAGLPSVTKTRAIELLAEVKLAISTGTYRKEGKGFASVGKDMAFSKFLSLYRTHLIEERDKPDTGHSSIHDCITLWEKPLSEGGLGEYRLSQLSPIVFEEWMKARSKEKKWTSNAAWNRYHGYGRAMFNWGLKPKVGLVSKNPFHEIDRKQEPRTKPPRLDDAGVTEKQLHEAIAKAYPPAPDHPKLDALHRNRRSEMERRLLLVNSNGARRTEMLKIQNKDINFKTWVVTLPTSKGKSKTGEEETLFIADPRIREILEKRRFLGPEAYPFGREDGRFQADFRKSWRRIFKCAGLPEDFVWHSLRHEFISQIAELTDNVQEVMELARHRNIQTSAIYMKAKEKRLKELLTERAKQA